MPRGVPIVAWVAANIMAIGPPSAGADQRCLLGAGSVQDDPSVVHPVLQRRQRAQGHGIRKAGTSLVEANDPGELT